MEWSTWVDDEDNEGDADGDDEALDDDDDDGSCVAVCSALLAGVLAFVCGDDGDEALVDEDDDDLESNMTLIRHFRLPSEPSFDNNSQTKRTYKLSTCQEET